MKRRFETRSRLRRSFAACGSCVAVLAALFGLAAPGCIEVGHDAELGCLVKPAEPSCKSTAGSSAGGSTSMAGVGGGVELGGGGAGGAADDSGPAGAGGDSAQQATPAGAGGAR